jgi:hypothetical protein
MADAAAHRIHRKNRSEAAGFRSAATEHFQQKRETVLLETRPKQAIERFSR